MWASVERRAAFLALPRSPRTLEQLSPPHRLSSPVRPVSRPAAPDASALVHLTMHSRVGKTPWYQ